jgi:hypothetical protein
MTLTTFISDGCPRRRRSSTVIRPSAAGVFTVPFSYVGTPCFGTPSWAASSALWGCDPRMLIDEIGRRAVASLHALNCTMSSHR